MSQNQLVGSRQLGIQQKNGRHAERTQKEGQQSDELSMDVWPAMSP